MNEVKEKLIQVGLHVLTVSKNELYLHMRFLDVALSALTFEMNLETLTMGTDGEKLLFNPRYLLNTFTDQRKAVNRAYLHSLLHCIFRHLYKRQEREEELWSLACDIAVESMIDSMTYGCIQWVVSDQRQVLYDHFYEHLSVLTAEGIYRVLSNQRPGPLELESMKKLFLVDDHRFWERTQEGGGEQQGADGEDSAENKEDTLSQQPQEQPREPQQDPQQDLHREEQRKEKEQQWQAIGEQMETNMETASKEMGEGAGQTLKQLQIENRERYDYRTFLEKFAVMGEELQVDMDNFDYNYYTYGLSLYGNMPLVEPLESREIKRIREFVIVLDTSESCDGQVVRGFLTETFRILKSRESFFRQVNIHIIQCDAQVQQDAAIHSLDDLEEYIEQFKLRGFGGTDFRPAFAYVNELIENKTFSQLKGMIYFTDGDGIFPKNPPPFETAFVFLENEARDPKVPPWAIKLVLSEEEQYEY